MNKSINQKLLEFQTSIEVIKKDGKNTFFKKSDGKPSTYATLQNILEEVKPILNALKLIVTQPIIEGVVYTEITDSESGESIKSGIILPTGLDAQKIGSAITYFRRYTLSSLLALEIDEDDDGNAASQPAKKEQSNPADSKPEKWLNKDTPEFEKAKQFIAEGGTMDSIRKKYKVSKEVENLLKS